MVRLGSFLLLAGSLISFHGVASAATCAGSICVGDSYVQQDLKKNVCVVTDFFREAPSFGEVISGESQYSHHDKVRMSCADGSPFVTGPDTYGVLFLSKGCLPASTLPLAKKVCVGEEYLDVDGNKMKIKGISRMLLREKSNAGFTFLVQFENKSRVKASAKDIRQETGCLNHLCAGDQVLVSLVKSEAAVHDGMDQCEDGNIFGDSRGTRSKSETCKKGLVLASVDQIYLNGSFGIRRVGTDSRPELHQYFPTYFSITKGCEADLCVGQKVMPPNKREATIVGLTLWSGAKASYVVQYKDTKKYGEGWKRSELTVIK